MDATELEGEDILVGLGGRELDVDRLLSTLDSSD